jgi:type IV pilus assembly protein PilV
MIEVMAALGLLTLGAAGVMALQKTVIAAGAHARNLAAANAIAMAWAERLRADGVQWIGQGPGGLATTRWLRQAEIQPGVTHPPEEIAAMGSPAADLLAADAYDGDLAIPAFCTHVRLTRLGGAWPDLIRAEIRVSWERRGQPIDCSVDPADVDAAQDRVGAVHVTAGVLRAGGAAP